MDKITNTEIRTDESYLYDMDDINFMIEAITSDLIGYYTYKGLKRDQIAEYVQDHILDRMQAMFEKRGL